MPLPPIADRAVVSAPSVDHRVETPHTPHAAAPPTASPFAQLLRALGRESDRGEATVRGVLAGGTAANLGPSELLALQAGIYRYGETVDLAAKLIDKAGTDVRTVLQGQQ
jgi:hypothetical protein